MITDDAFVKLATKIGHAESELLLKILAQVMSPEEARFIAELPASNHDLAAKFGEDEKIVENKLQDLWHRGLVVASRKGLRFHPFAESLGSQMMCRPSEYVLPGLDRLWSEFYESGWWREVAQSRVGPGAPYFRVVAAEGSLASRGDVLPHESVVSIIKRAELIGVRNCWCRVMAKKCERPISSCLQFDSRAEDYISRGSGRQVSVDEATAIALQAEQSGLIHVVSNAASARYICNCCGCCCVLLNPLIRAGDLDKGLAKSRFVARVDQVGCIGCQTCVEQCEVGAIEIQRFANYKKLKAGVDPNACVGCGLCAMNCQAGAIAMELIRPPEHIPSG